VNSILVSIICPLYNSEKYIEETILSVLAQTYKNWEMIIVDDCSIDGGATVVEKYSNKDNRVKLVKLEQNSGPATARNTGLNRAKGRFIAFVDSDDVWDKNKLEIQMDFMLKKKISFSFTSYRLMDSEGVLQNHIISSVPKLTMVDYLKNTIIGCSTVMIDRSVIGNFEFIDIPTSQDAHLWITILKKGFLAYGISKVLVTYRIHNSSITSNKLKAAKQVWNLYYNIEKLGFLRSCYYFSFYAYNAVKKRLISGKDV